MKTLTNFSTTYLAMDINHRINAKCIGAMLNPYLKEDIIYNPNVDSGPKKKEVVKINHFSNSHTNFLDGSMNWTGAGLRWFNTPDPKTLFLLPNKKYKKEHTFYPKNSFDMLNLGTCNH